MLKIAFSKHDRLNVNMGRYTSCSSNNISFANRVVQQKFHIYVQTYYHQKITVGQVSLYAVDLKVDREPMIRAQ